MKVQVIKPFVDRVTGHLRQVGTEFDAKPERVRELTASSLGPFVAEVTDEPKEPTKRRTKK